MLEYKKNNSILFRKNISLYIHLYIQAGIYTFGKNFI